MLSLCVPYERATSPMHQAGGEMDIIPVLELLAYQTMTEKTHQTDSETKLVG